MDGSGSAGPTCTAAAGTSPTCLMTGYTSGAATSWLTRGCSSPCRPGAAICSPCRDPRPRGRNGIGAGFWSPAGLLDWSCSGLRPAGSAAFSREFGMAATQPGSDDDELGPVDFLAI